jgi:hypothetical protein
MKGKTCCQRANAARYYPGYRVTQSRQWLASNEQHRLAWRNNGWIIA